VSGGIFTKIFFPDARRQNRSPALACKGWMRMLVTKQQKKRSSKKPNEVFRSALLKNPGFWIIEIPGKIKGG
jgi:hypothetical protein